jgi:hypothetical protein
MVSALPRWKETTMYKLVPEMRSAWKLVMVVVVAGTFLGWEVGAARGLRVYVASSPAVKTELVKMPHTSTVAVVTVPAAPLTEEQKLAREVARLRTRTRRLEATLEVMRQRELGASGVAEQEEDKR